MLPRGVINGDDWHVGVAAVGCADMSPASSTVLRRIDDTSEVRCLLSGVTWTLRCVGDRWDGELGVCERPSFNVQSLGDTLSDRISAFYNTSHNYVASLHPGMLVFRAVVSLPVLLRILQIQLLLSSRLIVSLILKIYL